MAKKSRRKSENKARSGAGGADAAKKARLAKRVERAKTGKTAEDGPEENALVEWAKSLGIAAVLFILIRTFLLQTFVITSGSMEDALLVGDFLLANRAAIGARIPGTKLHIPGYSSVRRGDVIVFDPPHEPDLKLVKRLVGMPGDTVEMRDAVLVLNGVIQDEPYVKHLDPEGDLPHPWMSWQAQYLADGADRTTYRPTRDNWGPLVIPEDRYFMLGDNRDTSLDGRYWGLLEGWRLEGRTSFIYFSYNKGSLRPFPWIREVRGSRIFSRIR